MWGRGLVDNQLWHNRTPQCSHSPDAIISVNDTIVGVDDVITVDVDPYYDGDSFKLGHQGSTASRGIFNSCRRLSSGSDAVRKQVVKSSKNSQEFMDVVFWRPWRRLMSMTPSDVPLTILASSRMTAAVVITSPVTAADDIVFSDDDVDVRNEQTWSHLKEKIKGRV